MTTTGGGAGIQLGIRRNLAQFTLLVIVNALVGAMVGLERTILPAIAEHDFHLAARAAVLSFIVVFGITKAATKQALDPDVSFPGPETDLIYDPRLRDQLFLTLSSLPLDKAVPAEWIAASAATLDCSGTQPITVDGASGALCSSGTAALVPIGGRGYVIRLYTGDAAASLESIYSPAWFQTVLDTVKLSPEKTVTGSPTPS